MAFSRFALAGLLICCVSPQRAFTQESFEIDPNHSTIAFAVKHMLINTVRGRFREFAGVIRIEGSNLSKSAVNVAIRVATIDTGFQKRDDDLRGADFLDVEKFPEIAFASSRVEKQPDGFALIGNLTMHGVTKEVKIPFSYNGRVTDATGHERIGVTASLVINRRDWGISYNKVLDNGGLIAANEVQIQLDIEAKKR
jgi:polyisoprenoid-binding protein YceI